MTDNTSAYSAYLVGDRQIGIVRLSQVTVDTIELVRDEIEPNVVCFVRGE